MSLDDEFRWREFEIEPLPPIYPDSTSQDFRQWLVEQQSNFEAWIDEQRAQFQNDVLEAAAEWERLVGEIEDQGATDEGADDPRVVGEADIPPHYQIRKKGYFSLEELLNFLDEAGITGYGELVFRGRGSLWYFALPPDTRKNRKRYRARSKKR